MYWPFLGAVQLGCSFTLARFCPPYPPDPAATGLIFQGPLHASSNGAGPEVLERSPVNKPLGSAFRPPPAQPRRGRKEKAKGVPTGPVGSHNERYLVTEDDDSKAPEVKLGVTLGILGFAGWLHLWGCDSGWGLGQGQGWPPGCGLICG